jgi:hypothetical protein
VCSCNETRCRCTCNVVGRRMNVEHLWNNTVREKPKRSQWNLSQYHFLYHEAPHELPRDWTRASVVRDGRLTAWVMARPYKSISLLAVSGTSSLIELRISWLSHGAHFQKVRGEHEPLLVLRCLQQRKTGRQRAFLVRFTGLLFLCIYFFYRYRVFFSSLLLNVSLHAKLGLVVFCCRE